MCFYPLLQRPRKTVITGVNGRKTLLLGFSLLSIGVGLDALIAPMESVNTNRKRNI